MLLSCRFQTRRLAPVEVLDFAAGWAQVRRDLSRCLNNSPQQQWDNDRTSSYARGAADSVALPPLAVELKVRAQAASATLRVGAQRCKKSMGAGEERYPLELKV